MVNITTTPAGIIGVVLFARHGDRAGVLYQNHSTYDSTQGYLTPHGANQEYALGSFLRQTYLNASSPSFIRGISIDVAKVDQLSVRADAGGGNVILDSAYALLQGLYPPSIVANETLATGQTVVSPLGGYQYIPVESLEYGQAPSLTSWMECSYFGDHLDRLISGTYLKNLATAAAPFLEAVTPYIGDLNNSFLNIWNIYDYVNVQYTHNTTFYESFPVTLLEQAAYWAGLHESVVFTGNEINSIGQVAIRTLWPEIIWSLGNMTSPDNTVKFALTEVDYKPFLSLFNVTNATMTNPGISGIANYASAVAFELSAGSSGDYEVAIKFKNGSADNAFQTVQIYGEDSVTLPQLISYFEWTTINNTNEWCFCCNQTTQRGCSVFDFSQDPFLEGDGAY